MNHCVVPDFEMYDDYPNIPSANFTTSKKSIIGDEEIMELVWQNGQIIMQSQSQNQRCMKKSHLFSDQSAIEETVAASAPLYMQEDEVTSLLQSPLDDSSFADFLYTPPSSAAVVEIDTTTSCAAVTSAAPSGEIAADIRPPPPLRPIIPQLRCTEGELTHRLENFVYTTPNCAAVISAVAQAEKIDTSTAEIRPAPLSVGMIASSSPWPIIPQLRSNEGELTHRLQNFEHFSGLSCDHHHRVRPSTIVESNETVIAAVPEYMAAAAATGGGREVMTACELTLTSSTSGSGGSVSASAEPLHPSRKAARKGETAAAEEEDRKRKGRESDDNEGQSEDVEFESADAKKQVRSSTSAKKSRAAEVHNLSERKRRDRINEKMRALQELIPRCNKSDKASMLDEAIEYLKSLQLQVQMMSTGCNMVPMMYPGIPQYMPTMGMNMGMRMSMEMGMNQPMVPYPPLMPGPAMQNAAAAAQMAPRYPLPAYHLPPFPAPDPSRIPVVNQPDHSRLNSLVGHTINQPRLPNFSDPYHQYFGLQQAQLMLPQNQGVEQPGSSKPNNCIEGSPGNRQSG